MTLRCYRSLRDQWTLSLVFSTISWFSITTSLSSSCHTDLEEQRKAFVDRGQSIIQRHLVKFNLHFYCPTSFLRRAKLRSTMSHHRSQIWICSRSAAYLTTHESLVSRDWEGLGICLVIYNAPTMLHNRLSRKVGLQNERCEWHSKFSVRLGCFWSIASSVNCAYLGHRSWSLNFEWDTDSSTREGVGQGLEHKRKVVG